MVARTEGVSETVPVSDAEKDRRRRVSGSSDRRGHGGPRRAELARRVGRAMPTAPAVAQKVRDAARLTFALSSPDDTLPTLTSVLVSHTPHHR
jgi:hypothetical protein